MKRTHSAPAIVRAIETSLTGGGRDDGKKSRDLEMKRGVGRRMSGLFRRISSKTEKRVSPINTGETGLQAIVGTLN